jgi:YfiH family protein
VVTSERDPLEVLTSPVIPKDGFVHGFPTRKGGVSEGLRASLNLGQRWGDAPARVAENRRRLAEAAGFDLTRLQTTRHVHGTRVWFVGEAYPEPAEFDVLVSARPGDTLGAFAADCIPILFCDPIQKVVAAAHAGWRGTVAGIARTAVVALRERHGSRPEDLRVALGPSIGPCCFEVGEEVVEAFQQTLPHTEGLIVSGPRKSHIDLRVATRTILEGAGVRPERIDDDPPCTRCDPERFFSFRRDGQDGGVHMGFIGIT